MYDLSEWKKIGNTAYARFIKDKPYRDIFIVAKISYIQSSKSAYIGTITQHDIEKYDYIVGDINIKHMYDEDINVLKLKIDIYLSKQGYNLEKFGV